MQWSPPLVELSRPAVHRVSPLFAIALMSTIVLPLNIGCSALPVLQSTPTKVAFVEESDVYSDAEKKRLSELPAVPDFDSDPLAHIETKETAVAAKTKDSRQVDAASPITGAAQVASAKEESPPAFQVPSLRIDAPKPFGWSLIGKTNGGRSFQTVSVGDEGYRTLVVGSVAGNDPLALELVEKLARHLHKGKSILGGFQTTIIRTLNPDGEVLGKVFNENGQYINHGFPKDNGAADGNQPAEVTFLLDQIRSRKPQRVIHIRSIEGDRGLIAASSGCLALAKDSSEWLGFRVIQLPENAVSGSFERHLAGSETCEVLTLAFPAGTRKNELWDRYGDTVLNLLMGDHPSDRELVRQPKQRTSANRQNSNNK
ncbi:MAG: hypothetical protein O2856_05645 [Planctomycetota bacterium]|nr:hypothetical protein [Planctomycetota bacterium]